MTATANGYADAAFTLSAIGPMTLTIAAGDGQATVPTNTLPLPLAVDLLGTDGLPYQGATVNWSVSGGGSAAPSASLTDGAGRAATTVTLGSGIGPVTVTATVTGVPQVAFGASALDPCVTFTPHTVPSTVNGTLSPADCNVPIAGGIFYYDFYAVTLPTQQSITVAMSSATFDTWIDFFTGAGQIVGWNDDASGSTTNSQVSLILGPGSYVVGANSYAAQATGPYTLQSTARSSTIAACELLFVAGAFTISETVANTDCVDTSTGSTFYSDKVAIYIAAGDSIAIRLQSAAFDPYVYIYDVLLGTVVAANDDSAAGTTTAFVKYISVSDAIHVLDFGTEVAGQTGSYTLNVASPAMAAASGQVAGRAGLGTRALPLGAYRLTPADLLRPRRAAIPGRP